MSLLQTRSLRAFYGDFQALFDIDVTVEEGDTIAVIGAARPHSCARSRARCHAPTTW